ncbi:uncharacterized protein LOC142319482 [Lycorma delicatula]|uniref:uncharacterized protein LOC142319482 n=1 Tax=Lycorma delicatula TaxID=130591 RepID=UPI003F51658D
MNPSLRLCGCVTSRESGTGVGGRRRTARDSWRFRAHQDRGGSVRPGGGTGTLDVRHGRTHEYGVRVRPAPPRRRSLYVERKCRPMWWSRKRCRIRLVSTTDDKTRIRGKDELSRSTKSSIITQRGGL